MLLQRGETLILIPCTTYFTTFFFVVEELHIGVQYFFEKIIIIYENL